jgi:hypothetical protein
MNRPSHKELFGKLSEARKAVGQGRVALLNPVSLAADAVELDYAIEFDLVKVLTELLEAASASDYTGSHPPQRSYEPDIQGLELFAFTVASRRFKCRVYLKFALAQGWFWLVSLHPDRPVKEDHENP